LVFVTVFLFLIFANIGVCELACWLVVRILCWSLQRKGELLILPSDSGFDHFFMRW